MSKYIISRTSEHYDKQPCPGSTLEQGTYLDYRTISSLEQVKEQSWGDHWLATGSNHRLDPIKGMVVRERPEQIWTIEIDDLLKFCELYGELVLSPSSYLEYPLQIEIYDDYRE